MDVDIRHGREGSWELGINEGVMLFLIQYFNFVSNITIRCLNGDFFFPLYVCLK